MARIASKNAGMDLLLVEDDQVFGSLAMRLLDDGLHAGEGGYRPVRPRIRWAQSMQEAQAYIASRRPEVIITDLHLPDSRGPETYAMLHGLAPAAAKVVLTGRPSPGTAIEAACTGAEFIEKEAVTKAALVRAIWMAVTRSQAE